MKLYTVVCKKNGRKFNVDTFVSLYEAQRCVRFYEELSYANEDFDNEYEVEPP